MALHHFPRIVTDGLVLCLDAGNPLSYPRLGPELVTNSDLLVADDGNYDTIENTNSPICYTGAVSTAGKTYQVSWKVLARRGTTSATLRMNLAGIPNSINFNTTPGILNTSTVTIPNSSSLNIVADNTGVDFDLDYVSIREMSTIINDISGNGNNGTLGASTAAPAFNNSNGGCLNFDGSNDYVSVNYSNSLQIIDEITLVSIFSPDIFGANRARLFDTKSNDFSDNTGGSFGLKMGTISPFQDISFFLIPDGSVTATEVKRTTSIILSTSQIYHVVARWRKSDGFSSVFVNGVECSYSINNSLTSSLNILINPITIGKLEWSPDIYGDQQVYCSLIYSKYLSDDEIIQNFNATKGRYGL